MTAGFRLEKITVAAMIVVTWLASAMSQALAEEQSPAAPCEEAAYRQLDFKLGHYVVTTASGKPAGRSFVEPALGGCLLLEHWEGAIAGTGLATLFFDRNEDRWHFQYVADDGETLLLSGKQQGEAIVFFGENAFYDFVGLHRVSWSPLQGGDVLQEWAYSPDKEESWLPILTGIYKRIHQSKHSQSD